MTRQEPLQSPLPDRQHLPVGHHPLHPIRQFLLPGIGWLVLPWHGLAQGRQLGHHRCVFAIVLRRHPVEDLRIIVRRLATDPLDLDLVVGQRLPQSVSIRPGGLHRHNQLPARAHSLQQGEQRGYLPGVLVAVHQCSYAYCTLHRVRTETLRGCSPVSWELLHGGLCEERRRPLVSSFPKKLHYK